MLTVPDESFVWGVTDAFQLMIDGRVDGNVFLTQSNAMTIRTASDVNAAIVSITVNGQGPWMGSQLPARPPFQEGVNVIVATWQGAAGTREARFLAWGIR